MNGKKIAVIATCIILAIGMCGCIDRDKNKPPTVTTLYVGGTGPNNYTSIQAAINAANNGDTVFVYDDSSPYYEGVDVDKSINLIGENRDTTVIDGLGIWEVVHISADSVNITGFTIRNSGSSWPDDAGIDIDSNYNTITGNNIKNNYYGISLYSSSNNIISENIISLNTHYGIQLYSSSNNIITGNIISLNNLYGISLSSSSNNIITGNIISHNNGGISLPTSRCNNITGNSFYNDGLYLYVDYVDDSYQNTVFNNMVNGKPLVYLEGESDRIIDDAGQVILVGCNNITVQNQELSNTTVGIELLDTDNCLISGNNISSNDDDGIYILDYSRNNNITGNNISNNRWGIRLRYSSNNNITDNNISNNVYGIFLGANNNNITGNSFSNDGLFVAHSLKYQNIVFNNTVNGKPLVYLENKSDMIIDDAGQVILIGCNNITVQNQELSNTTIGIELLDTYSCLISGNTISSNNDDGIYLFYSGCNNILGNIINSNNGTGIYLYYCSSNNISGNNINSNHNDGILLMISVYNTVVGNTISSNNMDGICLNYYSFENTISGNNISVNKNHGIVLLDFSSDNLLYHNNFINNTQQADYGGCTNTWDNGYPSGGNYWSDFDEPSGGAYDNNSDGIIDSPYRIPGGSNQDRYPLMRPAKGLMIK
jgi:parallel beta-helix repeat protein